MSVNTWGETLSTVADLVRGRVGYASDESVVTFGECSAQVLLPGDAQALVRMPEVIALIWEEIAKSPFGLEQYP
jgi:hypothetical protein